MPARSVITGATTDETWARLSGRLEPGDVVLFKASRRAAFERLVVFVVAGAMSVSVTVRHSRPLRILVWYDPPV